jgi:hypothetical protein
VNRAERLPVAVPLRVGRSGWLALALGATALVWYTGMLGAVHGAMVALARRPDVAEAFTHPEHGEVDALLLIISFLLLAPFALFIALVTLVFLVIVASLLMEPALNAARLPSWMTLPLVLMTGAWAAYVARDAWMPSLMHLAALVARAVVVYFGATPLR